MNATLTDKGLLTPENSVFVFVDFQPQMIFGVSNIDRTLLVNNVLMVAKAAKAFGVPTILTGVETKGYSGNTMPQLLDVFPEKEPIERTTMNFWEHDDVRRAIEDTGRKNLVVAALWTEACLAFPAMQALNDGYNVFAVEDACGGTSEMAHNAAMRRIEAAGAVPMTTIGTLLELQRDWARKERYSDVMEIIKEHGGAYGQGVEFAYTAVHGAPPSRKFSVALV